jgi:hypothetical protein
MKTEQERKQYQQDITAGFATMTARRRELAAAVYSALAYKIKASELELQQQCDAEGITEYGEVELNDYFIESMGENIDVHVNDIAKKFNMTDVELDIAICDAVAIAYKLTTLTPNTPCAGNA